jgi:molybdopterin molybdotransferase
MAPRHRRQDYPVAFRDQAAETSDQQRSASPVEPRAAEKSRPVPSTAMAAPNSPSSVRDVPWPTARELAHAAARPLPAGTVPLAEAAGLTLAEGIRTALPMPAFDTAAMDGFAVAGAGPWRVRGVLRAGATWTGAALAPGDAVEISTGAPVPAGADAVLKIEDCTCDGELVRGPVPPAGRHIRRAGEDAPADACLAPAGTRVGPALLGLAAGCGADTLSVRPRPRVRVLVTGDELATSGRPGPGRVRDALGPLLPPLLTALDAELTEVRHVPDHPPGQLDTAVHKVDGSQLTVVTGSTSMGATDQLRQLLHADGARWIVDTVACRPGHPQLLAELSDGRWVAGLPGNPYAALVAFHTLLGPLLAGLAGRPLSVLPRARLAGGVHTAPGRTRLIPVVWDGDRVRITGDHGAAFLRGAALGDALAAVPPDWTEDTPVPLVPLTG